VKSYRPAAAILSDIQRVLAAKPSLKHSPLEQVTALLSEGRHYGWVGIYLTLDRKSVPALVEHAIEPSQNQIANPSTRKKIIVSVKIAGREVGTLNVESSNEHSFGATDRVLLERVAALLARFLTGAGKYIVRKAAKPANAQVPKAAAA
jgi:putative methionine-R-sulfoxide reductase with GAF domain